MKNVIVVCLAGPRSSKWPRPIPSSCNKNSFSPLESRLLRETTSGPAGEVLTFVAVIDVGAYTFTGAVLRRGIPGLFPARNVLNRLILVRYVTGRFRRYRLQSPRHGTCSLCCAPVAMGILGVGNLHLAMDLRAFFDGNPDCHNISADFPGAPDFHALAGPHRAFHFSPNDDFARIHIGQNIAMRTNGYAAVGEMDGALHFPVDIQILAAPNFSFN